MIAGTGTDLFEVARMERALREHGASLAAELFTAQEIAYCEAMRHPARHYAARFAAKEAVLKALSLPEPPGTPWREIEVATHPDGRPFVVLHGRIKSAADAARIDSILVSLSHTDTLAMATVVTETMTVTPERCER